MQQVQVAKPGQKYAHVLVAKVAREAAAEMYEVVMGENTIREEWKRQNPGLSEKKLLERFVAKNWGLMLPFARATLTTMLQGPHPEGLKEEIMEALILDAGLRPGAGGSRSVVEIMNRELLQGGR